MQNNNSHTTTMAIFKDIADHDEDCRIRQIGDAAIKQRLIVAFIVDNEPDKPERYIRKLQERYPGIRVIGRYDGSPLKETVTVKVGPPLV